MRTIKFRIFFDKKMVEWHERGKEFYIAPAISGVPIVVFYRDSTSEPHMIGEGRLEAVMQYTGLKDKNKKEIYEGDVCCLENKFTYEVRFEDGKFVGVHASKTNGMKGQRWGDLHRFMDPDFSTYTFEVIGNIYENPELLIR